MKKFRLPPGLGDELDEQLSIENKVSFWMIKRLHERGFSQIKTPLLEYFELFEDYRMPNQKMYRLGARDSRELVIRPDMTLPVARFLSTQNVKLPAKFFYMGIFTVKIAICQVCVIRLVSWESNLSDMHPKKQSLSV